MLSGFRNFCRGCNFALVIALLIRTSDYGSVLTDPLDQIFMPAIRTFFRYGFRRRRELALRIISASVKRVALARALFDKFSVFTFRALHANKILLHVFAFWISAAGSE